MSGALAVHAGLAAEESVADCYRNNGYLMRDRRWKRRGGEIDLVMSDGKTVVFIEVKKARSFAQAAESLRPAQMRRLTRTAQTYLGQLPGGQDTDCRFDVALVDDVGRVEILPNAFI
ncbi:MULTISPECIES: YraN family protein [unclassified Meridianimarinicoccus]|uniref:YraN family protein n=1 Tax=unclassified Meridianimarinicoccus TaxID=2923344 RepID=UPI001867380B|nr:YraN family protein [Fluviibacterium sp. MJW13]